MFSLSDFLKFEESPFYSHQDRLELHRKKDDKTKQMNMTVPLLMLQISGSDYEIKRVFDYNEDYIINKANFNIDEYLKTNIFLTISIYYLTSREIDRELTR